MEPLAPQRKTRSLIIFFLIANLWTWLLWVPTLLSALRKGWLMPSPDNYGRLAEGGFFGPQHLLLAFLFSIAVYGPLLGAIIATAYERGGQGVRALLANTFNPRIAPRWYLIALVIAAALAYIPVLLAWLTGSLGQPAVELGLRLTLFIPILILQLLTSGLGEEPGWRGFLLPRLQERFRPVKTVWLLGLAWAVWHYPLTAIYTLQSVPADAPAPAGVISVIIALLMQTLGVIGLTYIYVWLYNRTNSIFLMIFFHALTNTLPFLVPLAGGPWAFLAVIFPWIIVLALRMVSGRGDFLRNPVAERG